MAKIRKKQEIVPSVLDRLIRSEKDRGRPRSKKSRGQVLRELKESIRRDLEDLLNTRWRCSTWPPDMDELDESLANYGLPDFTGANLGSYEHREGFRRIIQRVIEKYEPRFKKVDVKLVDNPDAMDRTMRFRIDALVHAEPAPEPVVFDSSLEPLTTNFEVRGAKR